MRLSTNKGICYAILAQEDRRLTPEAKYFLIRVIYLYGEGLVTATVKELSRLTGLSGEVIAKARTLLCSLGLVEVTPILDESENKKKSGRPRQAFKISPKFIGDMGLRMMELPSVILQDNHPCLLGRLLFWSTDGDVLRAHNVKKGEKPEGDVLRRHTFTVATRILLAVLYIHSNPCGMVSGIGLARLSKITGLSSDRLQSQLEVIKDLGYLIDRVSGLTGKRLFGRAVGAFFLNVGDEDIRRDGRHHALIAFETNKINQYVAFFWGYRIYNESRAKHGDVFDEGNYLVHPNALAHYLSDWRGVCYLSDYNPEFDWSERLADLLAGTRRLLDSEGLYLGRNNGCFKEVSDLFGGYSNDRIFYWTHAFQAFRLKEFFCDLPILNFSKYLQYRFDHYTAILLSVGWGQIIVEKLVIFDEVLEHIASELFPKPLKDDDPESVRRSALALFVYCIAYQQALLVKYLILKAQIAPGLLDSGQMRISLAILPVLDKIHLPAKRMTIAMRVRRNGFSGRFYAVNFINSWREPLKIEKFSLEDNPDKCREMFRSFGYDLDVLQGMTK